MKWLDDRVREYIRKHPDRIDVILKDDAVPREEYEKLKEENKNLKRKLKARAGKAKRFDSIVGEITKGGHKRNVSAGQEQIDALLDGVKTNQELIEHVKENNMLPLKYPELYEQFEKKYEELKKSHAIREKLAGGNLILNQDQAFVKEQINSNNPDEEHCWILTYVPQIYEKEIVIKADTEENLKTLQEKLEKLNIEISSSSVGEITEKYIEEANERFNPEDEEEVKLETIILGYNVKQKDNSENYLRIITSDNLEDVVHEYKRQEKIGIYNGNFKFRVKEDLKENQIQELAVSQDPKVNEALLKKGIKLKAERKLVTFLETDVRGFTKVSTEMEPELLVDLLTQHFDEVERVGEKHEMTWDKWIGDASLTMYGAPYDDEYQATNALEMSIELQGAQKNLNHYWIEKGIIDKPLEIGIGLCTGEAVVGRIGSTKRKTYTGIGDPVNNASRLCDNAPAGEIYVAESTYNKLLEENNLMQKEFEQGKAGKMPKKYKFEKIENIEVKGKEAQTIYRYAGIEE